jgi:para-nitrobenzyl esterase
MFHGMSRTTLNHMSIRTVVLSLIAVVAVSATAFTLPSASGVPVPRDSDPAGRDRPLVRVESGWLRGNIDRDHVTYSAVPYAAPPIGERRWRPPATAERWRGVRDATRPSPLCPQHGDGDDVLGQEDCLYLDVTAPRDARPGNRLPVLVWLHGGGLTSGGAQRFDGSQLATRGDLVVVTINYRLGALGFLSTPELGTTGGNYGLMDQAAALRWVRRNAARFGGDPRNVTLAGQSGGARSVCAHLASPMSRGLIDRAIVQSGACDNDVPSRAEATRFGTRAIEDVGCTEARDVAACLRDRSPADLVGALAGVGMQINGRVADRPWNPVAGTRWLPVQPGEALREGSAAPVPLVVGGTRDEMRGFVHGMAKDTTEEEYRVKMSDTFGKRADDVLAQYPAAAYESPALALASVLSDWGGQIGACPVLRSAEAASPHQPVYAYEFAEDSGQAPGGFPLGAYHGLDVPYIWTLNGYNPYPPLTQEQQQLSATMIDYWAAFAHTGDPNGSGRPRWPEFGPAGTVIGMSIDGIASTPFAEDHRCDFWADLPR